MRENSHHPKGSEPRELKHLSTPRKRNQNEIFQVAASERGIAQTIEIWGCGHITKAVSSFRGTGLESPAIGSESLVPEKMR